MNTPNSHRITSQLLWLPRMTSSSMKARFLRKNAATKCQNTADGRRSPRTLTDKILHNKNWFPVNDWYVWCSLPTQAAKKRMCFDGNVNIRGAKNIWGIFLKTVAQILANKPHGEASWMRHQTRNKRWQIWRFVLFVGEATLFLSKRRSQNFFDYFMVNPFPRGAVNLSHSFNLQFITRFLITLQEWQTWYFSPWFSCAALGKLAKGQEMFMANNSYYTVKLKTTIQT